jgi:hypothetical protein
MKKNNLFQKLLPQIRPVIAVICVCPWLLFSCSKTEQDEINTQPSLTIAEAKEWYMSNYQYPVSMQGQANLLKNSEADSLKPVFEWEKPLFEGDNSEDVIEVPIHYSNGSVGHAFANSGQLPVTDDKRLHSSLTRLVILKAKGAEKRAFLMTLIGDPSYLEKHNYDVSGNLYKSKQKDFTGLVLFYTPEGKFINGWRYHEGKVNGAVSEQSGNTSNSFLKSVAACSSYQVTTYWEECTDWYGGDGHFLYTTCNNYTTTSYYSVCTGDGGGGGGGSGGGVAPAPTPTPTPAPVVNASELDNNPIAKCVYNRLLANNIFNQYLEPFKPQNSFIDLRYHLSTSLPDNTFGQTRPSKTSKVADIYINENILANRSSAAIAGTFIHETVHAYIFCYMEENNYNYDQLAQLDKGSLFMLFMENKTGTKLAGNEAQHLYMAESYLNDIANAIKLFEPSLTSDQCHALAWSGLQNTPLFKYKTEYEQNNINATLKNITLYGKKDCSWSVEP